MKRTPGHLLRVARNVAFAALGVPLEKQAAFEEALYRLNRSLREESPSIGEIMDTISDEEIVYQKGEGPEVALSIDPLVPRKGFASASKYFIAKRIELVRHYSPDLETASLLDVGATSDLVFRYLGKPGTGLNISARAVAYMQSKGIEAVEGNAERLPYPDKAFDYTLCFETVEHLENPMAGLRELARVSRKRVFVSIPLAASTTVCPFEPEDRGRHRWHFIEFSPEDFLKVVRRAGLEPVATHPIIPVGAPRSLRDWLFRQRWKDDSWFEGYLFLVLEPREP